MDVNAIAALATQMSQQQLAQDVGTAVLKKAIDTQAQVPWPWWRPCRM